MKKEKTKLCKYCKEEMKKGANNCPHCGKYQGLSNGAGCGIILLIIILVFTVRGCSDFGDDASKSESSSDNSPYISYSEFAQIETGMTYNEVCEIIGSEGKTVSQVEIDGMNSTIMTWNGDAWSGSNATVYFENGLVTSKAQIGLD